MFIDVKERKITYDTLSRLLGVLHNGGSLPGSTGYTYGGEKGVRYPFLISRDAVGFGHGSSAASGCGGNGRKRYLTLFPP